MSKAQEVTSKLPDFLPTTFKEAQEFADILSRSNLCPKDYKGKKEDIVLAMQMGARLGLDPFQAVQGIAVINGRPCVWGDAAIAIARNHPGCISIREWLDGSIKKGDAIAYCAISRKGQPKEEVRSFSVQQAVQANLLNKAGAWAQYPERMLQMRARGFALRDVFPDALKGLKTAEEVIDIPEEDHQAILESKPTLPPASKVSEIKQKLKLKEPYPELPRRHVLSSVEGPVLSPGEGMEEKKDVISEAVPASSTISGQEFLPQFTLEEIKRKMEEAKDLDNLMAQADLTRELQLESEQKEELRETFLQCKKKINKTNA